VFPVRADSGDGINEEILKAYEDVDAVIDLVQNADLARPVARSK
jgi:RNA-splicing ligase RtcB